jgi:type I restriction enzyme S subunit
MATNEAWQEVRLGDLIRVEHGWPFKSEFFSEEVTGGPIVVSIGNFRYTGGFRFESTTVREYRGEYPRNFELRPGDILLVMTCQTAGGEILGLPAKVPDDGRTYLHNQRMGKVKVIDHRRVSRDFLYWLFLYPDFNRELFLTASGTKILHTSPDRIESYRFRLPPLPEQRLISRVLDTLQETIDLNRQMNETLEAIAKATFKSWFVEFDPVRAKMEGRQPAGMDADTAALFPNTFDDSPIGKIPRGWKVNELKDRMSNLQYGITTSATQEPLGPRFLRITDIQGGKVDWSAVPFCEISASDHERYRVRKADIFVARTGASTGENVYVVDPPDAVFASYLVRFQFADVNIGRIIASFMRTQDYRDFIGGIIGGSAQPNASAQTLSAALFPFPSSGIAKAYADLVKPMDERRAASERESQTLGALRDALLPKLLSGEIRIPSDA